MAMGGVGEAMLLGAAMGGGSAALMGRDPLKGALVGGLTGGAGAGISGALAGGAEGAALAGATEGAAAGATGTGLTAGSAGMNGLGMGGTGGGLGATTGAGTSLGGSASGLGGAGMGGTGGGITTLPNAAPAVTSAPAAGAPSTFSQGMSKFAADPLASIKANPATAFGSSIAAINATRPDPYMPKEYDGPLKRYNWESYRPAYAEGGITTLASGGYDRMVGEEPYPTGMASGGISSLGSYSDGGRMLKGPGDGMSDNIPATIAGKRPARLADGEFVMPADVVSHLGNGSTDAGAKQLYAMMDRVRKARTGRKSQGREINAQKYMVA